VAIGKSINAENLFEKVVLAYKYDCEHLKDEISTFLLANSEERYFTNLTMSNEWIDLKEKDSELANQIESDVKSKMGIKV
jgi:hypothetical protein